LIAPQLGQLGLRTLVVPSRTLADVFEAISLIGRAAGHRAQARELAARVHSRLDAVRRRTSRLPRRRILLVVDRTPGTLRDLYVATRGSFLADLVDVAGGQCVAAPEPGGYSKISKEAVVALAPELIVDFVHGSTTRLGEDAIAVWNDLSILRAVRERQVYPVRNEFMPHASQFVADTAELFAHIIHPEPIEGKAPR
jgi:iron complex transport system substrate-binding protein